MKTLLLVDGNALMHRAFHALPPFKTSQGVLTQVLYGFLATLHKTILDFHPSHLMVCFDTPAPTFRNKLFKKYQSQRPEVADDFISQIPSVKKALDEGQIYHIEKDGFEADDLIGTVAHKFKTNDISVLILSGDKDILQLVDTQVLVISPAIGFSKGKIYDREEIRKRFFLDDPHQIIDFKALAGDPSDNYPGAKGIGPKTAAKILKQYQTVERLLRSLDKMEEGKIKKIIQENKENIILAKKLAMILTNVPIKFQIEATRFSGFNNQLKDYLLSLEMRSLANRIFQQKPSVAKLDKKERATAPQLNLF